MNMIIKNDGIVQKSDCLVVLQEVYVLFFAPPILACVVWSKITKIILKVNFVFHL